MNRTVFGTKGAEMKAEEAKMTNKEAIQNLIQISRMYGHKWQQEACEIAIEALKTVENLEEIKAKERCRAIDDFAEMLKNRIDTNREYVIKHNMPWECANPDKCDIDEIANEIKGVNE